MKIVKKVGERLPPWLATEIRPILAFTGAGSALVTGSRILTRRGWDALSERLYGWEKYGAIAASGYVMVYAAGHAPDAARFAVPGAVVAWCVAAWWVAPPPTREKPGEQPCDEPDELTLDELAALVRRVSAHRQGAHLADLLQEPELVGWTQPELKATAVDFGLPVEEFKLILRGRQRVRDGVRVRDLPPAPAVEALPGAPADPAPQPLPAPSPGPE